MNSERGVDSSRSGQGDIVIDDGTEPTATTKRRPVGRGTADGPPCAACGAPLSVIRITVDGRDLLMESCDGCDTRRWQLAGERIDLQEALSQVGEHAGRRRPDRRST